VDVATHDGSVDKAAEMFEYWAEPIGDEDE
jgi:hypothetical protein